MLDDDLGVARDLPFLTTVDGDLVDALGQRVVNDGHTGSAEDAVALHAAESEALGERVQHRAAAVAGVEGVVHQPAAVGDEVFEVRSLVLGKGAIDALAEEDDDVVVGHQVCVEVHVLHADAVPLEPLLFEECGCIRGTVTVGAVGRTVVETVGPDPQGTVGGGLRLFRLFGLFVFADVLFIDEAVAVVVDCVAGFLGAGVDLSSVVVAIGAVRDRHGVGAATLDRTVGVSVAVAIGVGEEGSAQVLVDVAIAVVVQAVADLAHPGVDLRAVIVAVEVVLDEEALLFADLGIAGQDHDVRVAIAIDVTVCPEGRGDALVDVIIAIVVEFVADLFHARVDAGLGVITVGVVGDVAFGSAAGLDHLTCIAEAVCIDVRVEELQGTLVCSDVAVVVDPIADLRVAGEVVGIGVVAVVAELGVAGGRGASLDGLGGRAVPVAVGVDVEDQQVAGDTVGIVAV